MPHDDTQTAPAQPPLRSTSGAARTPAAPASPSPARHDSTTGHPGSRISAVFIVKDEEDVLEASLAALGWVDEIVVYDTGSTDRTREIAAASAATVVEGYWDDSFGAARNRAVEHATGDWVLTVDADEVFSGDPATVRAALDPAVGCHLVLVDNVAGGGVGEATVTKSMASVRLYLRGAFTWAGRLHEQMVAARPGADLRAATPVPTARLAHSGYLTERMADRSKARRNLELARLDVEAARRDGLPATQVAVLEANLSRSLGLHGDTAEGLETGRRVLGSGLLARDAAVALVPALVELALALGQDEVVDELLEAWIALDTLPARPLARKAYVLALRQDAARTLETLDLIPAHAVDDQQVPFRKSELAPVEVWALLSAGRAADAAEVAVQAAAAGLPSVAPARLVGVFRDADRPLADLLAVVDGPLWGDLALQTVSDGSRPARSFLEAMDAARPGDVSVLLCGAALAPALSIEEAVAWSVRLRTHGLAERCPLVALSRDEAQDPRQRAVAAAIAVDVYSDERAVPGLEAALADVSPEHEAELASHLEIVAPGLVSLA